MSVDHCPQLFVDNYLIAESRSTDNNIILRHEGSHFDCLSVLYESIEAYPYKMLAYQGTWPYEKELIEARGFKFTIEPGHYLFQSKNGIHWQYVQTEAAPVWAWDRSNMSYDSQRGMYMRLWKNSYKGVRARQYAESRDLVHWSTPRWLLIPQWPNHNNPVSKVDPQGTHFYGHLIFNHGSLHMGLLEILNTGDHRMHVQLMSRGHADHGTSQA